MGSILYGPDGKVLESSQFKKAAPPKMGEAFGERWLDSELVYYRLPGGGILQFNLNRLNLADFRLMRDHYQVNAALSVLTFMMHQLDWKIECDNERIRKFTQENMERIWTQLVRSLSQAFWAGYSPNVLQWENDLTGKSIQLTKVKDLVPEDCTINWKPVDGWAPPGHAAPKYRVYDGIKQYSLPFPIPVENTLWYPLLRENGDWYGRKLLRPAFTSWYFSIIIHLFANRYFERFGEPLPIGRAPYDDVIDINGEKKSGRAVMLGILQNLRSRGVVVLPSERSAVGTQVDYDYNIEYLESQMRGADFERYLMRLDEEISLAMFTPLLMLRTADVGSYSLGTQHSLVYSQMLNALSGDWAMYINQYVLNRMVDFNFSPTSPRATIKFRKLGDDKMDLVKAILQALLSKGTVKPDLIELGDIAGLTLQETEALIEPSNTQPERETEPGSGSDEEEDDAGGSGEGATASSGQVADLVFARLEKQIRKAYRDGTFGQSFVPDPGYRRQLEAAFKGNGLPADHAVTVHSTLSAWVSDLTSCGVEGFASPDDMMPILQNGIRSLLEGAASV